MYNLNTKLKIKIIGKPNRFRTLKKWKKVNIFLNMNHPENVQLEHESPLNNLMMIMLTQIRLKLGVQDERREIECTGRTIISRGRCDELSQKRG